MIPGNHRNSLDIKQLEAFEEAIAKDLLGKQAFQQLGVDPETCVALGPWIYGADLVEDQPYIMQFLMYLKPPRMGQDGDPFRYSSFVSVVEVNSGKITHVD
ncbi:uncharacterized protein UTRI_10105 [Ustilago trichophora]|uniref:Uncharacterized protein n=1 Tax=Ustilago trichophora TaxID=86804 RepID=A0A5C3E7W7_9BASI|nr:uncharacterized protein UTRI_10105 [Ustilago trichophora]